MYTDGVSHVFRGGAGTSVTLNRGTRSTGGVGQTEVDRPPSVGCLVVRTEVDVTRS